MIKKKRKPLIKKGVVLAYQENSNSIHIFKVPREKVDLAIVGRYDAKKKEWSNGDYKKTFSCVRDAADFESFCYALALFSGYTIEKYEMEVNYKAFIFY